MQNFTLLRELGHARTPVLLKRGISATIEEWLLSAEYILAGGNMNVMLCERGIRTFESYTRNTLDISAIPVVRKLSHLPILVDPSHGTGLRDKVAPMARAAVAAGADGLLIEVHHDPDHALSDGAQSLFPAQFDRLMAELRIIAPAIGRSICLEPVARRGWGVRASDAAERLSRIAIVGLRCSIGGVDRARGTARGLRHQRSSPSTEASGHRTTRRRRHRRRRDIVGDDLRARGRRGPGRARGARAREHPHPLRAARITFSASAVVTDVGSTKRADRRQPPRRCRRGCRSSAAIRSPARQSADSRRRAPICSPTARGF